MTVVGAIVLFRENVYYNEIPDFEQWERAGEAEGFLLPTSL